MNWKLISGVLCMLLLMNSAHVLANEDTYIVTLKNTATLFGIEQNDERNYMVVSSDELAEYLQSDIVEEYEPNYRVELFSERWNLDAVDCKFAWELGCLGNEVKIGVIDSGLYPFTELEDNVIQGKDYLTGSTDTTDNIGHGTFVTGIIASESNGISYKSKIVPLKCFDKEKETYVDDILDAIYDAVDVYDCDVINMSLGVSSSSSRLQRAVTYAVNHGALVVSAVGNDGSTVMYYPAGYDNAVGVGSVNKNYEKSAFSQYNSSVFVTAPGESLKSLSAPGYTQNAGTSFSAPHVTALAAVAKCIDDSVDTEKFMALLSETSQDLGDVGYDKKYGHGLVNFEGFIAKMLEDTEIFISPLCIENNKVSGVIYNNSLKRRSVTCINANYNGNQFLNMNTKGISLGVRQKYVFENDASGNVSKYMVWEDLKNICPATQSRMLKK